MNYQDYNDVYGTHDQTYPAPESQQQQRRYLPQHIPSTSHLTYSQNQHPVPQQQLLIPTAQIPLPILLPSKPVPSSSVPEPYVTPSPVLPIPSAQPSRLASQPPPAKRARPIAKRKAPKKSDNLDIEEDSDDDDLSRETTKTKSGRKIQKPSQYNPSAKTPSKKRGTPGKKAVVDSLFCKVCDRGHSPRSNLIVFCDGCNTPYHQLCHIPVIDNLLITLPDAEWFCAKCDERRGQQKLIVGHSGAELSEEQKKSYLAGLPTSHLVQLVLLATSAYPELNLFSPNAAKTLEKAHLKHEAAIMEERAKMFPGIYQSVPGDELPFPSDDDKQIEEQVMVALSKLDRPLQNRDIIEYIEANYVIDPQSFRVKCAEQISRSVKKGQLIREGTMVRLDKQYMTNLTQSRSVKTSKGRKAAKSGVRAGSQGMPGDVELGGGFIQEQYPRVVGIKLPESTADDGFLMQETDSPAFTHTQYRTTEGYKGHVATVPSQTWL